VLTPSLKPAVSASLATLDSAGAQSRRVDRDASIFGVPDPTPKQKELMQVAKQFEAIFASQMFAEIGKKLPGTSSSDSAGSIYGHLFADSMSAEMAQSGSLGLARILYRDLAARLGDTPAQKTAGQPQLSPPSPAPLPQVGTALAKQQE